MIYIVPRPTKDDDMNKLAKCTRNSIHWQIIFDSLHFSKRLFRLFRSHIDWSNQTSYYRTLQYFLHFLIKLNGTQIYICKNDLSVWIVYKYMYYIVNRITWRNEFWAELSGIDRTISSYFFLNCSMGFYFYTHYSFFRNSSCALPSLETYIYIPHLELTE